MLYEVITVFGGALEEFCALETPEALMRWDRGDAGLFLEIAADLDLDALGRGAGRYMSFGAYPLAEGHGFAPGLWEGVITSYSIHYTKLYDMSNCARTPIASSVASPCVG